MGSKAKTPTKSEDKLISILSKLAKSKTLDHFNVQMKGKVGRVFKKGFLLNREGSVFKIELTELTRIQKEVPSKKGEKPKVKSISFKKIRKGDEAYVNLYLTEEGEIGTKGILVRL